MMKLIILPEKFTFYQFAPNVSFASLPAGIFDTAVVAIMKTPHELSVLLPDSLPIDIQPLQSNSNWRAFQVDAVMEFSIVGVMAKLSGILAAANVPLLAFSTYNTDYLFVEEIHLKSAIHAFENAEIKITFSAKVINV